LTDSMTGMTRKTGLFLFLAYRTERYICIKNKKDIYSAWFTWFCRFFGSFPLTMLEKDITSGILSYLKSVPRCFAWKEHGGMYGTAGLPDIIACVNGRFFAFEVKAASGKLSKIQEITLKRINDAKGHAFKVTSVKEVTQILERLEGDPNE
jgi:hypothetical protein